LSHWGRKRKGPTRARCGAVSVNGQVNSEKKREKVSRSKGTINCGRNSGFPMSGEEKKRGGGGRRRRGLGRTSGPGVTGETKKKKWSGEPGGKEKEGRTVLPGIQRPANCGKKKHRGRKKGKVLRAVRDAADPSRQGIKSKIRSYMKREKGGEKGGGGGEAAELRRVEKKKRSSWGGGKGGKKGRQATLSPAPLMSQIIAEKAY